MIYESHGRVMIRGVIYANRQMQAALRQITFSLNMLANAGIAAMSNISFSYEVNTYQSSLISL